MKELFERLRFAKATLNKAILQPGNNQLILSTPSRIGIIFLPSLQDDYCATPDLGTTRLGGVHIPAGTFGDVRVMWYDYGEMTTRPWIMFVPSGAAREVCWIEVLS